MIETEFLTPEELNEITGYCRQTEQREWLDRNGWPYALNASGRPVVGRWFARMRLAGIQPTESGAIATAGLPNFAALG